MTAEPALSLSVRRGGPAGVDADLSLAPGEILALTGPSGAGKTTLLRIIAGLVRPGEGRITCGGETWQEAGVFAPPYRRRTGLVFQSYALLPHLTALRNILMSMQDLPPPAARAEALRLMEALDLQGLGDRKPANLSGGQQQRVALARALARRPSVLLLDEPLSAVDRRTRRRIRDELAALRGAGGPPVLLVTHDLDEAAALADRLAVMEAGRILRCGPPAEVLADPEVARVLDLD
ncbi:MAG: ABC transporter ATP-binding protein [Phenylobacterium sp.]